MLNRRLSMVRKCETSRGLLCDCKIFANLSFQLYYSYNHVPPKLAEDKALHCDARCVDYCKIHTMKAGILPS